MYKKHQLKPTLQYFFLYIMPHALRIALQSAQFRKTITLLGCNKFDLHAEPQRLLSRLGYAFKARSFQERPWAFESFHELEDVSKLGLLPTHMYE